MLLDLARLIACYDLRPTGVLHLGAHLGEEAEAYRTSGIERVIWIEGNPELLDPLSRAVAPYGHHVISALIDDRDGEPASLHVTNNFESSSILPLGTHQEHHREIHVTHSLDLVTTTIDALARAHRFEGLNFLNVDLQGAELRALQGATETLRQVDYVYSEVNREQLYEGCALVEDLDDYLRAYSFDRVITRWTQAQWGDALYIRGGVSRARRLRGQVRFSRLFGPFSR